MTASTKILMVEDEPAIREMLSYVLRRANFEPLEAADARQAYAQIADQKPDLVLVDWMLPGQSGLDIVRRLREDEPTAGIPIIMLTARGEEYDRVRGLDHGADDYVTKPFSPRELVARIQALLRRSAPDAVDSVVTVGELTLDPACHEVRIGGKCIEMGPTEFRMLRFFMTHQNRVYSRSQLLDRVWNQSRYIEERTVDVHILRLRKALGKELAKHIRTVREAGYQFHSNPPQEKKKSGKKPAGKKAKKSAGKKARA